MIDGAHHVVCGDRETGEKLGRLHGRKVTGTNVLMKILAAPCQLNLQEIFHTVAKELQLRDATQAVNQTPRDKPMWKKKVSQVGERETQEPTSPNSTEGGKHQTQKAQATTTQSKPVTKPEQGGNNQPTKPKVNNDSSVSQAAHNPTV